MSIEQLDRVEKKLDRLLNALPKPKKTWVPASVVRELTGWDKEKLRQRREQGLIKWEIEDGHFKYLLESIHPLFIKPQSTESEIKTP